MECDKMFLFLPLNDIKINFIFIVYAGLFMQLPANKPNELGLQ